MYIHVYRYTYNVHHMMAVTCAVLQYVAVCCSLMTCQELTSCVVPPQKQHCNTL